MTLFFLTHLFKVLVVCFLWDFPLPFKTFWFACRVGTFTPLRNISIASVHSSRITQKARAYWAMTKCPKHHSISTKITITMITVGGNKSYPVNYLQNTSLKEQKTECIRKMSSIQKIISVTDLLAFISFYFIFRFDE